MKPRITHIAVLITTLSLSVTVARAQPPGTSDTGPSLRLPRITATGKPGPAAPLLPARFSTDPLSPGGGANRARRNLLDYLAVPPHQAWSSTLRGNSREPTFASFLVHGSANTIIEVGGARLGVTAGPVPGTLQLMFDDSSSGNFQWRSLNLHVSAGTYAGKSMAALPVLTVALDPATSTWHLYAGTRLLADHLPLHASRADSRRFTITAGKDGAWICSLVLADDNPLFADDNVNGIDDAFERQHRGGLLLASGASVAERQGVAKNWRTAQQMKPPPALFVARPAPDPR